MSLRNVRILAVCQALYTSALAADLTLTGLVGYQLAPSKAMATVPFSIITLAAALTTIFASLWMQRVGRRRGFMLGALVGAAGGAVSVYAILHADFWLFCVGTASVGIYQAFAQYYRLAAADGVAQPDKGRAIATVLTGGVIAAVCGPALANWSKGLLPGSAYAGAYAVVALLGLIATAVLGLGYRNEAPPGVAHLAAEPARPLREIVRQPRYQAALATNVIGYAVMMFLMTATPLAMMCAHRTVDEGAGVIQWHLVGMYAPALVSGWLIRKLGVTPVVMSGIALSACTGVLAIYGDGLVSWYLALLCLGVGWNFMFVGGSTWLTQSYRPAERGRAQALSEFSTFAATALASLLSGQLLAHSSWITLNVLTWPLLGVALLFNLRLLSQRALQPA
ncbi:MFS transporter [Silvimonas sp. JCM 19000]